MLTDDDDLVTARTPEQWAMLCALKIQEEHGDRSHVFIAEMIGRFALEGNFSAIETYKGIARAYDQLMRPGQTPWACVVTQGANETGVR